MNRLLFFAELREKLGKEEVSLHAEGKTVEELVFIVGKIYSLPQVHESMVAINEEFVPKETEIKSHDTIAFIPPVSGG